jgi:hypothetical protein
MRILKGLGTGWQEKGVGCGLEGLKVGMLKGKGERETQRALRRGERFDGRMDCVQNMEKSSMGLARR